MTLTVQLAKTTAMQQISPKPMNGAPLPISLGLLLLPLAALRRRGVQLFRRNMWLILLAAIGAVTVAGLSSCAGHASNGSGGAAAPQTYTLTVTATSGTLSNSTALTLTVQ